MTGLTLNTAYSFTVLAYDAEGNLSSQSDAVATTTLPDTTSPTTPGSATFSSVTTSAITLSWTASTDAVGVSGYRIYRGATQVGTTTLLTLTNTSLSSATSYSYTIEAYDAAGNRSTRSATTSTSTLTVDTTAPTTPGAISFSAVTTSSLTLTFASSTDAVGVSGYRIYRAGTQVGTSTFASFSDSGLSPSTSYAYTVSAYDAANNISVRNATTSTSTTAASDTTAPTAPGTPSFSGVSSTTITLTWASSTDAVGVSGYRIYRAGTQVGTSTYASFGDSGLSASTSYSYTLEAYDAAGNRSTRSATTSTTTSAVPDTTAPTTSGAISFSAVSSTTITLRWASSTDGVGVSGYKVYRAGTQIATATVAMYTNTGLSASTSYSYNIAAYDAAGNVSARNATTSTSTLSSGTSTPVSLSVANLNGTNGFNLFGFNANEQVGRYVDGIGDLNNDGYSDIIISGASVDTPTTVGSGEGESYVILGSASGLSLDDIYLNTLDGTNGGFRLDGGIASGGSGQQVSSAGDVNNDSFADILIGTPNLAGSSSTAAIYLGRVGTNASSDGFNLENISPGGGTGLKITSTTTQGLGLIMDGNGDFNGDGYSDVVVGQASIRQAYMVIGKSSFGSNISINANTATTTSINFTSTDGFGGFGAIGYAGDVDGDGRDDLMLSLPGLFSGDDGKVILYYGTTTPGNFDNTDIASTTSGTSATVFTAPSGSAGELGRDRVTGIGDINKDGYDDFAMVAPYTDNGGRTNSGSVYVVFGTSSRAALNTVDLNTLDGTNGFRVDGGTNGASTGYELQVASAGDFNGDTIADFIVGDSGFTTGQGGGRVYVIFGSTGSFASLNGDNLNTVMDGISDQNSDGLIDGFKITGQGSLGRNIAGAGDMNNDGYDDLILGAFVYTDEFFVSSGAASVVYGWSI